MCLDHKIMCCCGRTAASFILKDEAMPAEIIKGLYCPECSADLALDPSTMVEDNGWVIDYDMEIARFADSFKRLPRHSITPEFLFDEGYCTWKGVYPGDVEDSAAEKAELLKICSEDRQKYVIEFRKWAVGRMGRLAEAGWRKAREA